MAALMFLGSSNPIRLVGILCDQTGCGKNQYGGLYTSNSHISASRQDINTISMAALTFLGSSNPLGLVGIGYCVTKPDVRIHLVTAVHTCGNGSGIGSGWLWK